MYSLHNRKTNGQAIIEGLLAMALLVPVMIGGVLFLSRVGAATYYSEKLIFVANQAATFAQANKVANTTTTTTASNSAVQFAQQLAQANGLTLITQISNPTFSPVYSTKLVKVSLGSPSYSHSSNWLELMPAAFANGTRTILEPLSGWESREELRTRGSGSESKYELQKTFEGNQISFTTTPQASVSQNTLNGATVKQVSLTAQPTNPLPFDALWNKLFPAPTSPSGTSSSTTIPNAIPLSPSQTAQLNAAGFQIQQSGSSITLTPPSSSPELAIHAVSTSIPPYLSDFNNYNATLTMQNQFDGSQALIVPGFYAPIPQLPSIMPHSTNNPILVNGVAGSNNSGTLPCAIMGAAAPPPSAN